MDAGRILIVDDEVPIRRLLRTTLSAQRFEVLEAGNAAMMTDDDLSAPSVPSTPAELPATAPAQPAEPAPTMT